jgi:Hemopexin
MFRDARQTIFLCTLLILNINTVFAADAKSAEIEELFFNTPISAAITLKNGVTYLFSGRTFAKTNKGPKTGFVKGYPKLLPGGWKGFPRVWPGISAGFSGQNKTLYMFSGKDRFGKETYYRLTGIKVDKGFPKKITDDWIRLPKGWSKGDRAVVDAAFYHPPTKKHFMFKDKEYARLNDLIVEKGYPKKLPGGWKGMPKKFAEGIDAATYRDGHVYMFKDDEYIRFTKQKMDKGYPKKIKDNWPK